MKVQEQLDSTDSAVTKILDSLLKNKSLVSLTNHHRNTFISLYRCNSKGKEKYLHFQLEWHKYCSIFLLPKESCIDCIFPDPNEIPEGTDNVKDMWQNFCEACSEEKVDCNKFMILFSSALYHNFLELAHTQNIKLHNACSIVESTLSDEDDVYFRFGGATLSDLYHNYYKDLKKCSDERKDIISKQIKILNSINTKDKSAMPLYLKYRDRGHMFSPNPSFIPFFRSVDSCIKEVVNDQGFQKHGDELVKVYNLHDIHA